MFSLKPAFDRVNESHRGIDTLTLLFWAVSIDNYRQQREKERRLKRQEGANGNGPTRQTKQRCVPSKCGGGGGDDRSRQEGGTGSKQKRGMPRSPQPALQGQDVVANFGTPEASDMARGFFEPRCLSRQSRRVRREADEGGKSQGRPMKGEAGTNSLIRGHDRQMLILRHGFRKPLKKFSGPASRGHKMTKWPKG